LTAKPGLRRETRIKITGGEILKLGLLTLPTKAIENIRTQNVQYMNIKIKDPDSQ